MSDPAPLSRTHTSYSLRRTETASSLRRELSNVPSEPDINAPIVDGTAEFPEEYTMETETGLVPQRSLRELRGTDSDELEKGDSSSGSEIEYVTFTVNDPDNPKTGTTRQDGCTPSVPHSPWSVWPSDQLVLLEQSM